MTHQEAFRRWLADNPLAQYRFVHNMGRLRTAALLGVSDTTIKAWEAGASAPSPEHLSRFERLDAALPQQWQDWLAKKPGEAA